MLWGGGGAAVVAAELWGAAVVAGRYRDETEMRCDVHGFPRSRWTGPGVGERTARKLGSPNMRRNLLRFCKEPVKEQSRVLLQFRTQDV